MGIGVRRPSTDAAHRNGRTSGRLTAPSTQYFQFRHIYHFGAGTRTPTRSEHRVAVKARHQQESAAALAVHPLRAARWWSAALARASPHREQLLSYLHAPPKSITGQSEVLHLAFDLTLIDSNLGTLSIARWTSSRPSFYYALALESNITGPIAPGYAQNN